MKKVKITTIVFLIAAISMAQEGKRDHAKMKDMSAEQIATLRTKKMTLALDLTDNQQKQIQELNLEHAITRKKNIEKRKALKEKDDIPKPTLEEKYNRQIQHLDQKIAHKGKIKNILSPDQYIKWEKMAERKIKHEQKGKQRSREVKK